MHSGQWPELYRLMVARSFPDTPPTYKEARPYFEKAKLYGLMEGSELLAGFVFGPPDDGVAFFDVVCTAGKQGRWATPAVMRALYELAFGELNLRCVWAQPANKVALKAALKAGFVAATPLDAEEPVLVMTPHLIPGKFRNMKEQGETHGEFI